MTAAGQLDRTQIATLKIEQRRGIDAAIVLACGGKIFGFEGGVRSFRKQQHRATRREPSEHHPAIELHA